MRIVLDTNFLVLAVKEKIGIFLQLRGKRIYVIGPVMKELDKIAKGRSKDAVAARVALMIVKTKNMRKLRTGFRSADRALLEKARKGYVIATQDSVLRRRIKKAGGKVLYIRQKKYVVFE
ncbi:MAG: PIN domain-containing protein [Candidatus Aenigmatarchaeota archaeon]